MKKLKRKKFAVLFLLFMAVAMLSWPGAATAQEVNDVNLIEDPNLQMGPEIPGRVEGTGTYFEVTDSNYLNITFESSEPVHLMLESVPEMVLMDIEAAEGATSTLVTFRGFTPSTTYYKYQDDYHSGVTFTTDGNGNYSYVQDLNERHLVFIQPRAGTRFIPGDTEIGTWDPVTRTYTLTTDVYESIEIDEGNLTLDGAGHRITGTGTGYGVHLYYWKGVTIKNVNVQGFVIGIFVEFTWDNTVMDNIVANNYRGIHLLYVRNGVAGNTTVVGNTVSNNSIGISTCHANSNILTANVVSNNSYGIIIGIWSNNNTLIGNTVSNNDCGIYMWMSSNNNTLTGNAVNSNSQYGIYLSGHSNNNTLTGNTASNNNGHGIYLYLSSGNILTNCTCSGNSATGMYNYYSDPIISNCTFTGNADRGMVNDGSSPTVTNCILWGNMANGSTGESAQIYGGTPTVAFSCIQDDDPDDTYIPFGGMNNGNIDDDPLFADASSGDYHLKSEYGRWEPETEQWILDAVTSPCINTGDPLGDYSNEPAPNGRRVNMGAYGNTSEASKSPALSETFSEESNLLETLVIQNAVLENVGVTGDFDSTLNFTSFEIVTITTGPWAGKGFSKGQWETNLEGICYTGDWKGALFLKPEEGKIYLRGAISGEISATVEGDLTESIPGSNVYDQYETTWKVGWLGTTITSAIINLDGDLSYQSSSEFPATELYVLQTNHEGILYGDYGGPLSTVVNQVRIADGNNPYNGEGFSIISYVSDSGSGQGWTYDKIVSPGRIELNGVFSSPLFGIAFGILDESELPRAWFLRVERVDLGLPPMADLEVKTWGPTRVSPGQTVNYIIEYRNDGLKAAEDIELIMKLPYEVEFTSATSGGTYKEASHDVVWYLGNVLPKSTGNLSAKVRVLWGLPLGTVLENIVSTPKVRIEVPVDPNIAVDYEIIDANEIQLKAKVIVSKPGEPNGVVYVEISRQEVTEWRAPIFEYVETEEGIEYRTVLTVEGSWQQVAIDITSPPGGNPIWELMKAYEAVIDHTRAWAENQNFLAFVNAQDRISQNDYLMLTKANRSMCLAPNVFVSYIAASWPDYETTLEKYLAQAQPGFEILVGQAIYEHETGPLPDGWESNPDIIYLLEALYDGADNSWLDETSHDTDSHESEVNVARDPSVKYGPEGRVSPGQRLDYTVEYENEGEGIAFGVYFTDTLDEDLDDSTLEIGPVIDVNDGSIISGPGTYNPATRTITWFAGEVDPNQGGYAEFSVNVRADAEDGTEIINFATIYFPSVPEETRTNGIVSFVPDTTPPVISNLDADYLLAAVGQTVSFSADVLDNCDSDVDLEWDFGDGTPPSSDPSHSYGEPNIYIVTVTATDDYGNSSTDSIIIVVYDPSAGFTSGGGWFVPDHDSFINGDYVTDTVSKANFGFIVKYKKGADNPDGNLEFQYKAGDINLRSQDMEWLVVQSATKVRFKGKATINGEGSYTFKVTAEDNGEPGTGDWFKIEIWMGPNVNTENSPPMPKHKAQGFLGGGNIQIHQK